MSDGAKFGAYLVLLVVLALALFNLQGAAIFLAIAVIAGIAGAIYRL